MKYFIKQVIISTIIIIGTSSAFIAQEGDITIDKDNICVENGSDRTFIFAAEAGKNTRLIEELGAGERLCVKSNSSVLSGVVSVYEEIDAMEGCSRIVPVGRLEIMFKFSDADRCLWSSNS